MYRIIEEKDIPSLSYYSGPLHLQPVFDNLEHKEGDFPVAEKVANEWLSLPVSPYLNESKLNWVIVAVRQSFF